jgi:enamine deaminase RidA (YjgF/YER057c/UK114 family)
MTTSTSSGYVLDHSFVATNGLSDRRSRGRNVPGVIRHRADPSRAAEDPGPGVALDLHMAASAAQEFAEVLTTTEPVAGASPRTYVSGTSSVAGHETVHQGDVEMQCHTALGNIRYLISAQNTARHGLAQGYELADLNQVKVYVHHAKDIQAVQNICGKALLPRARIAFLNAEMCRRDLLVALEGVAR